MKTQATKIVIIIGVVIIGLTIFFAYSAEQAKIRGFNFGNNLQAIQDELKQTQNEFYSKKTMLDENSISRAEFLNYADLHIQKMKQILAKYDSLNMPQSFSKSVELFKLSTQKQIESDELLIKWVRTNNTSDKIRSDLLLQESFENEMAALASYSKAKNDG